MAKCYKCGAEVLEGALFCTECGAALTEEVKDAVSDAMDQANNPFEMTGPSKPSNPFAEMEANVPKPELASMDTSSLIFDEPDWRKAEKIEAQADAAQEIAAEAAAQAEAVAETVAAEATAAAEAAPEAATQTAYNMADDVKAQAEAQTANGQKGIFDAFKEGMAGDKPQNNQASFNASDNAQANASFESAAYTAAGAGAGAHAGWQASEPKQDYQSFNNQPQYTQPNWNQNVYNQDYMDMPQGNDKLWAILSYFWLILWVVAFFVGGANGRRSNFLNHHLNQSLILSIISTIGGWIGGAIGWGLGVIALVFGIMGIVYAAQGSTKPLPLIGNFKIFR